MGDAPRLCSYSGVSGPKPKQRSGNGAAAACLRGCLAAVDPLSQGAVELRWSDAGADTQQTMGIDSEVEQASSQASFLIFYSLWL